MKFNLKDMWRGAAMWLAGLVTGWLIILVAGIFALSIAGATIFENPLAILSLGGLVLVYLIIAIPVSWWLRAKIYDMIVKMFKLK